MAGRESLDDKLAALRALRGQTLTAEQKAELRKRIGDRSNLVVAAAAAIAGENTLADLAGDLEAAFDRFLVNPLKDDKLCRAKLAIVQALDKMEHQRTDVFLKAARHVQFEPVWGGSEDSAPPLRAAALVALARAEGTCSLPVLVDAMADPAKDVRIASAVAPGGGRERGRRAGPPPQGPARRQGPRRVLRMPRRPARGRCRRRTCRSSPSSLTRPIRPRCEAAAMALGRSRLAEALDPLKECLERCHSAELRQQLLLAIAILRRPAATDYLIELVATAEEETTASSPCRRCGSTRKTRGCASGLRKSCESGVARGCRPRSIGSSGRSNDLRYPLRKGGEPLQASGSPGGSNERLPPGGPPGVGELAVVDHLVHRDRQVRLADRPHLVLEPRRHGHRSRVEARLSDLLEPGDVLPPQVAVGAKHLARYGGYAAASSDGVVPWPNSFPHWPTGFGSPKAICGIAPSTTARWPSSQSGWLPPPDVGRVRGASRMSSASRPVTLSAICMAPRIRSIVFIVRCTPFALGQQSHRQSRRSGPGRSPSPCPMFSRTSSGIGPIARCVNLSRVPSPSAVSRYCTWLTAGERHEHRAAELQQRRRLDDLHVPPEVAGVVAEVAIPAAARPRLDHHRERLAARHLPARADLLEHRLEGDLDRRGDLDLPGDGDGLDFLLDIAHRHAQSSLSGSSRPAARSFALRSARSLMRSSW